MTKSIEISQIEESLLVIHMATCHKCAKEKESVMDEPNTFSQSLYKDGWRVIEMFDCVKLYCPTCAQKLNQ